jgi:NAD(P)-dependent dehydrogenase (short-subunit alcohol dehydrogenase family)
MTVNNKVAVFNGAASGIGKATAELLGKQRAKVVISDIQEGKALADSKNSNGGKALFIKADVGNASEMEALIIETVKNFGALHIAVNNAGIGGESNAVADMSIEGWLKVININLNSIFFGMKYQIQAMLNTGGGSIVKISSILGSVGYANAAAYTATKHGIIGLTQTAALEYAAKNIRINAVGPGFIDTPLVNGLDASLKQQIIALHPIGRLGKSEEVAALIEWLASDAASFVTGSYYAIDGGYLAR